TSGDIINVWRKGEGTFEFVQGENVRIRGIRDIDNRFFINDRYSPASLLCVTPNLFRVFGNMKRGSLGAVKITSYSRYFIPPEDTSTVQIIGVNFSESMVVNSQNATVNNFTYISSEIIEIELIVTGVEG